MVSPIGGGGAKNAHFTVIFSGYAVAWIRLAEFLLKRHTERGMADKALTSKFQ